MKNQEIYSLVSRVLGVELGQVDENLSPQTNENWDSLATMHLMVAIEDAYGIRLTTSEVMSFSSVAAIVKILDQRVQK